jgi:RNA polymerase sigma-70 factor (ECF subfamily)
LAENDEKALLKRLKHGDRAACETLVQRYHGRVYGLLVHLSGNPATAQDLTQETFATVWQKIRGFRGNAALSTWLHRIAYNKYIDHARRESRRQTRLADLPPATDAQPDPGAQLAGSDDQKQLVAAVQALPAAQREVIVLHYFQELSYRDMATVLGQPTGTIKWRTAAALKQLKHMLTDET